MPEAQLVELEQALLPEQALAEQKQERRPVSHPIRRFRIQRCRNLSCRNHCRSSQLRSSRHSIRPQLRIHMTSEPELLHGEPNGRSRREHRSKQKPRMGCSSSCFGEPGHRFRQQLRGELVRPSRSDRRRKRS